MLLNVELMVKIKKKGVSESQSERLKFEEYRKILYGEEYQRECNKYIIRSLNHEMYLQKVKKSTQLFSMIRGIF